MQYRHLQDFLEKEKVRFDVISHTPAYTAQEIAANAHIPGKWLAKTVIIKADGRLMMLVTQATKQINFKALKKLIKAKNIELASEFEFQERFPGCETGAMPPFGNLYNMDVYVDDSMLEDKEIAFNAGNHTELVMMRYDDWARLTHPKVVHFH